MSLRETVESYIRLFYKAHQHNLSLAGGCTCGESGYFCHRHSTVNVPQNIHNTHIIAQPWFWYMDSVLMNSKSDLYSLQYDIALASFVADCNIRSLLMHVVYDKRCFLGLLSPKDSQTIIMFMPRINHWTHHNQCYLSNHVLTSSAL